MVADLVRVAVDGYGCGLQCHCMSTSIEHTGVLRFGCALNTWADSCKVCLRADVGQLDSVETEVC